ncbi:hypothetical protein D3C73_892260 [compost metagenome]
MMLSALALLGPAGLGFAGTAYGDAVLAQDTAGDLGRADHGQGLAEMLAPQLVQANFLRSEQAGHWRVLVTQACRF